MEDSIKIESATNWLSFADEVDYEITWKHSSGLFQSAIELDDWRKSLKAARAPLGPLLSRVIDSVNALENPAGAPDGNYVTLLFNSSFEKKAIAKETVTLVEEQDGQWRTAGYFIN